MWANANLTTPDLTVFTIPASIYTLQDNSGVESKHIPVRVLFDSGAITRDLVSLKTVNSILDSTCIDSMSASKCKTCVKKFRGFDGHCADSNEIKIVIKLTT